MVLSHQNQILNCQNEAPLLKKAHVQAVWSLPMIQRRTGWKCCGQMRHKSSSVTSTQLAVFSRLSSRRKSAEGAEDSSCQTSASKPEWLGEDLQRGAGQNPSMCATRWPTTRNAWPLWLPTRVPPSTKSCFAKGSNTYLTHSNSNKCIIFFKCVSLDFFVVILSLIVKINLPLKL